LPGLSGHTSLLAAQFGKIHYTGVILKEHLRGNCGSAREILQDEGHIRPALDRSEAQDDPIRGWEEIQTEPLPFQFILHEIR